MRPPLIAGNWKMYKTPSEAKLFVQDFLKLYNSSTPVEVLIAPPFTALSVINDAIQETSIVLAAQNIFGEPEGAYTGEISPSMVKDLGCTYVILGHSERRHHFGETNHFINQKIHSALTHDLIPILCVGESLEERQAGQTHDLIKKQLLEGLRNLTKDQIRQLTIAYEPVWAIGTGLAATVDQATEVHTHIGKAIAEKWGIDRHDIRILYGGSVNPENAANLFQSSEINGTLIGKACLNPDSFAKIISCAESAMD
ncbi:MAG: triose-phosphate isomerase [Nitrospirales bacterium]